LVNKDIESLVSEITDQLPDLYLAELVQVDDFIRGIKAARQFLASYS
jgi:hypothetical protein